MKEIKRGLLIGRMQPVHNGHIEVIKETLKEHRLYNSRGNLTEWVKMELDEIIRIINPIIEADSKKLVVGQKNFQNKILILSHKRYISSWINMTKVAILPKML